MTNVLRTSRRGRVTPLRAYPLFVAIDVSKLRHGKVRGRYFRENFAQAGIDLTQIIPSW